MEVKIENATPYETDDLRALIRATLRAVGYDMSRSRFVLRVEVVNARSAHVSGRASLGDNRVHHGLWMKLRLPKPAKWTPSTWQRIVALTIHECMHLVGSRHKDMTEAQRFATLPLPAWAKGLTLRVAETVPVVEAKAAARSNRLAHANQMLRRAETRAKRAATILAKWKRRVRAMSR